MSRSRKKRKHRQRPAPTTLSATGDCDALESRARSALNAGRHKDAIAAYKALLKEERRPHWLDELARAYEGRAAELAGKGMFKEAVAICEQRAVTCEKSPATPRHIIWLLHAGRDEPAIRMFRDEADKLEVAGGLATLREHFAAFALAGHTQILESLPADDPVVRDYGPTQNAMRAYCHGDDGAFEASLKAIPFRSPYRNFRQLLKTLHLRERDPEGALARLQRIDDRSPFGGMADMLRGVAEAGNKSPAAFAQLDPASLGFAAVLNGWSEAQLSLLQAAAKLGPTPDAQALFNLVLRYRQAIGEDDARDAALNLLSGFPRGVRAFTKTFGYLSPHSVARLKALAAERDGDPYTADEFWRQVLDGLYKDLDEGDNRLRAALILRRLADQWLPDTDDDFADPTALDDLAESLRLDPDDSATHVRLIAAHRSARQMKQARACLNAALERFPEDTDVLLEAVETAIAGNAFKKAAGYAKQLLRLDPINVKVQNILLDAHAGHARKQIKKRKYPLARRELDEASSWARSAAAQGKVCILRGMLEFAASEPELGRKLLHEGAECLGGGLAGQFQLLLESERLARDPRTMLKLAQLPKPSEFATRDHVLALLRAVSNTTEDETKWLDEALEPLADPVRRAAVQPFSQAEMEFVCETLHRHRQLRLLEVYARQAIKRWPDRPVFIFHRLYGKGLGHCFGLDGKDMNRLNEAIEQAEREGDMRTVHRIVEFMEPPVPFGLPRGLPPLEGLPHDIDDIVDEIGIEGVAEMLGSIAGGDAPDFIRDVIDQARPPGKRRAKKKAKVKLPFPDWDQGDLF